MTAIDLSGGIIVLTHTRTGSSLLMQTLHLLGATVIGERERKDLPQAANPNGYFEDEVLLRDGLHAATLVAHPELLRGRAVKLALRTLVARRSRHEWAALTRPDVVLLLPIRSPAESLLSRRVLHRSEDVAVHKTKFHWSARHTLIDIGFLAARVCARDFRRPVPICIDYRQAIDDPAKYVATVATAAGLDPSPVEISAAVDNINSSLYRVRVDDAAVRRVAEGVRPLEQIYDLLRSNDPVKWRRLYDRLPAWILEACDVH